MNFSGIVDRSLIGKLLRLPLRLIPATAVVPIIQGPLRGKRWIVGSSNHGCWLGSYEFEKQKIFIEHVKEGQAVYDIGANVGFYTLLSSHLVGNRGQVIAFEPLPSNIKYLQHHMTLNHTKNIRFFEKAVSDHYGQVAFGLAASSSMGHLSVDASSAKTITVETVALDRFVAEENLPIPDVIKVDIEGEEFNFLKGAKQLLENNHIKLFLATHGDIVHKKCLAFLHDIGYELTSLSNEPLDKTDEILAIKRM